MFRYYVSFTFQSGAGMGVASIDITTTQRIAGVEQVNSVRDVLVQKGYVQPKVLAFSLYATDK